MGQTPVRIEIAAKYSAMNEDDFDEVARLEFNRIPVVSRPIKNPILGGGYTSSQGLEPTRSRSMHKN